MTRFLRISLCLIAVVATVFAFSGDLQAQVTNGNITGTVTAKTDGSALPGVTIEAIHVPTGTRYASVAGPNGSFFIPNARIGGPYKVTASLEGFKAATAHEVFVKVGESTNVLLTLNVASVTESITVTAKPDDIISPNRTGSTSTVATQQIETLPTINRSLADYARTNPYFGVDQQDISSTRLYVAGRNNRYNSIQIDGAVNNDLFGLSDTGTPGGQTNANPISLDAIQQLQLVVSPYDVRQGGFTGGGINAVTRSGSNKFEGSVFGTKRNQNWVGNGPLDKKLAKFHTQQVGGRFGGPIMQDKLFFFVTAEVNRRTEPTGVSADGLAPTQYNNPANAQRLRDTLKAKYNYDPGDLADFPGIQNSKNYFGRVDFNLASSHQITLRHNYVDAIRDTIANRSSTQFRFPTSIYTIADKTNSTVAQVNSVFSGTMFNEGRLGLQTIKDVRNVPVIFPSIEIGGTPQSSPQLSAGTERFSGANSLDQKVTEITDDLTWIKGNHTLVFGTHNEIFDFKNLFLSEAYGFYYFPTLDAFDQNKATEYRISYATGSNPRRPTAFKAGQYGFYVNDQWRVSTNLALNLGLRLDQPTFPDSPSFNQAVMTAIGYSTANKPGNTTTISPRFGFNWNPGGTTQQVRGGLGVFAGRAPYVWISNAYGNTGVESVALGCLTSAGCTPPLFNPDPAAQPKNLGSAGSLSVDLVDPNFKFPRVLRGTLGYDRDLWFGFKGTAEILYTKTQEDVYYTNVNKVRTGVSPLDGRPTYAAISSALLDAVLLTNTTKGREIAESLQISRPFTNGLTFGLTYAHQDAKSAFDATSSRAISNWRFQHSRGDIFTPDLGRSAFETKHRGNISLTYALQSSRFTQTFGMYYNIQSGRPYSLIVGGDPNLDNYASNDLLYVPSSADAIIMKDSSGNVTTYDRFAAFLKSAHINPLAGRILNKYESYEPFARQMDLHYGVEIPWVMTRTEFTMDFINFLNALNNNWGRVKYVSNQNYTAVNYRGLDAVTGKPIYQEAFSGALNPGRQLNIADNRSRWQARLGMRVSF